MTIRADTADPAFKGVYPMLFAFLAEDGSLDEAAIRRQVRVVLAGGAHGVAVLGLASEAHKMSTEERLRFLEWTADEVAGAVPISVTVSETSAAAQAGFCRRALRLGADWLILQPPAIKGMTEASLLDFFAEVAAQVDAPVGVQLAPDYLSGSLSVAGVTALARRCPNVTILKVELPAIDVARLIAETGGRFAVFNGRDGLELPDSIAAGCAGIVPGAEITDRLVGIYDALTRGDDGAGQAEADYRALAPLIGFLMSGIDNFLIYGKRLMAHRMGLPAAQARVRSPSSGASEFGLAMLDRWSRGLDAFGAAGGEDAAASRTGAAS